MTGLHGEVGVWGGIFTTRFLRAHVRPLVFNIKHGRTEAGITHINILSRYHSVSDLNFWHHLELVITVVVAQRYARGRGPCGASLCLRSWYSS